jgi:hypothetical protein
MAIMCPRYIRNATAKERRSPPKAILFFGPFDLGKLYLSTLISLTSAIRFLEEVIRNIVAIKGIAEIRIARLIGFWRDSKKIINEAETRPLEIKLIFPRRKFFDLREYIVNRVRFRAKKITETGLITSELIVKIASPR